MTVWTWAWWKAALERALKTLAQTLIALIGAEQVNVISLDWANLLGIAATAALISVLTSLASAQFGNPGPSLADEDIVVTPKTGPDRRASDFNDQMIGDDGGDDR